MSKPYSALVVDDEQWIREGIKSKLSKLGFPPPSVHEASTGLQALELMEREPCDIVISDICMDEMDGLKLLETLTQRYPLTQKVIVSGYSEFDYAVKAMQHGVAHYLLKPIDTAELQAALKSCVERLEANERRGQGQAFGHGDLFAASENYRELLGDDDALRRRLSLYRPGRSVLACAVFYFGKTPESPLDDILRVFQEKPGGFSHGENALLLKTDFFEYALLWCGEARDRERFEREVREAARRYGQFFLQRGMSRVSAGLAIGADDAPECLRRARHLMHHGVLLPDHACILPEDTLPLTGLYALSDADRMACWHFIRSGSYHEFTDILHRIQSLLLTQRVRYNDAEKVYQELVQMIQDHASKAGEAGPDAEVPPFWQHRSLHGAFKEIRELYLRAVNLAASGGQDPRVLLAYSVKEYIDGHFDEPLSLDLLARKFHATPSYLSSVFKGFVGKNYQDYLLEVRISAAKELMREKRYKIKAIAEIVGFQDHHYFSKVFKKLEGASPSEYVAAQG